MGQRRKSVTAAIVVAIGRIRPIETKGLSRKIVIIVEGY